MGVLYYLVSIVFVTYSTEEDAIPLILKHSVNKVFTESSTWIIYEVPCNLLIYARILCAIFNKSSWRRRDELIRDVLLWIPTHGRAKAGRPARTYIQQLCEDTGCCPEDLPRAMNDREEWRERVRDIRAASTI